jgi:hypothetical protein
MWTLLLLGAAAGCQQTDTELLDKISQRTHWLRDRIRLLEEQVEQNKNALERLQTRYVDLNTRHQRLDLEFKLIQGRLKPLRELGEREEIEQKIFELVGQVPTASVEEWPDLKKKILKYGRLVVEPLLETYKAGNIMRASELLLAIDDPEALPALVAALDSTKTRSIAVEALGKLGQKDALEYLVPYLEAEDPSLALKTAFALGELGDMSGVPLLIAELDHADYTRRFLAVLKLRNFAETEKGYKAEDNPEKRKPAIARWKAWWRSNKERFDLAVDAWRKKKGKGLPEVPPKESPPEKVPPPPDGEKKEEKKGEKEGKEGR